MKPIRTERTNANFVLCGCGDLPATKCHDHNGAPYIETCWVMDDAEKAIFEKTGQIFIVIAGLRISPMVVEVESSILDEGEGERNG